MTDLPSPERQKALLDDWFASVHYDEAVDWREAGVDEDDDEAVVAALTRKRDGDGDGFVDDGLPTMRPVIPGFDLVPKQRFAPGFKGQQRLAPKAPAPTAPVRPWGNGPLTDAFEATIADWDTDTKSWRGFHSFNARRYEDNLWQMFTDPKYRALKPEVFAGQVAALDMIDVSMGLPALGARRVTEGPLADRLRRHLPDHQVSTLDEFAARIDDALANTDPYDSPWAAALRAFDADLQPLVRLWDTSDADPPPPVAAHISDALAAGDYSMLAGDLTSLNFAGNINQAVAALGRGLTPVEREHVRVATDHRVLRFGVDQHRRLGRVPPAGGPMVVDSTDTLIDADRGLWGMRGLSWVDDVINPITGPRAAPHRVHALSVYDTVRREGRLGAMIDRHGDPVFLFWGNPAHDAATAFTAPGTSLMGWRQDRAIEDALKVEAATEQVADLIRDDDPELADAILRGVPVSKLTLDRLADRNFGSATDSIVTPAVVTSDPDVRLWKMVAFGDVESTMRHEYGHIVDSQLGGAARLHEREAFFAYVRANPKVVAEVSTYAGSHDHETFAEFFAVWSHPRFADRYGFSPEAERAFELFDAIVAPPGDADTPVSGGAEAPAL
jgi:hypothetical protein